MWRFILLAALGLTIGSRARSERQVVLLSLLFGLLYGGAGLLVTAMAAGSPSVRGTLLPLGLGLVLAAPVYAIAELWRRARARTKGWLRRLKRR
jgi:predicted membrane protein